MAMALTGAAGPDGQEGRPAGTVFIALATGTSTWVEHRHWDRDDPAEVCGQAVRQALHLLHAHLQAASVAAIARDRRRPENDQEVGPGPGCAGAPGDDGD